MTLQPGDLWRTVKWSSPSLGVQENLRPAQKEAFELLRISHYSGSLTRRSEISCPEQTPQSSFTLTDKWGQTLPSDLVQSISTCCLNQAFRWWSTSEKPFSCWRISTSWHLSPALEWPRLVVQAAWEMCARPVGLTHQWPQGKSSPTPSPSPLVLTWWHSWYEEQSSHVLVFVLFFSKVELLNYGVHN